jgi:hypothetical protein
MKYKVKTISFLKMVSTYDGFLSPLCNKCKTCDCDNPIENKKISLLGITHDMRMFVKGDQVSMVIFCEGYTSE